MSPEGDDRSQGDGSMDEGWQSDPFRQDADPLRPRPPLRDPFEPQPQDQRPDPFASQEDPFGLQDPFQPAAPPFDPRRDYIDPFEPEPDRSRQPGSARPPESPPPATPPPAADPFDPAPGPAQPYNDVRPFGGGGQAFPERGPQPSHPAPPPPPPPVVDHSGPPGGAYGAGDQRSQAPIPSRAARHQAKKRRSWRPSRGPAGAPPAAGPTPPAVPTSGVPPAGEPFGGVPPAGEPAPESPAIGGSSFEPAEAFEANGWRPAAAPAQSPWPSAPANGDSGGFAEHARIPRVTEPLGRAGTAERREPPAAKGLADPEVPAWPGSQPRRGRVPDPSRLRPSIPKLDVSSGIARSSLGLAAILIVAALALGTLSSSLPQARQAATPATAAPYSARWVCPLLPGQTTSVDVANVGGGNAALRTTVISGSERGQPARQSLGAGIARSIKVPAAKQPGYVQVEAFSAPVVVSAGAQSGCAPGPTDRLWIPTSDTSLGASTTVVLANPDGDPAVVDLVPHVSQGSQQAVAEIFVPPRSAVVKPFSYGELVGLKPAIELIAKSGRVVGGALIAQKDKQRVYVPAQTAARKEWSFAGGLTGPDRSTFVLITNPSSTPLSVSVQVSTDRGTFKPGNDFDNPVPGGAAVAVQVPPLRIGGSGAFAVRVRSRGNAEFVAALRVTTPSAGKTVSYVDLGTSDADTRWLVPAVPTSRQVVLANLSGDALSARLGGAGGVAAAGTGAGARANSTVRVGPGKVVVRTLPAGLKSLEVTTDQTGLLVAPLGSGLALPGAAIGGVPAGGPVVAEPAESAAP